MADESLYSAGRALRAGRRDRRRSSPRGSPPAPPTRRSPRSRRTGCRRACCSTSPRCCGPSSSRRATTSSRGPTSAPAPCVPDAPVPASATRRPLGAAAGARRRHRRVRRRARRAADDAPRCPTDRPRRDPPARVRHRVGRPAGRPHARRPRRRRRQGRAPDEPRLRHRRRHDDRPAVALGRARPAGDPGRDLPAGRAGRAAVEPHGHVEQDEPQQAQPVPRRQAGRGRGGARRADRSTPTSSCTTTRRAAPARSASTPSTCAALQPARRVGRHDRLRRDRPDVDALVVRARCSRPTPGSPTATGYIGEEPLRIGLAFPDAVGGLHGAFALLGRAVGARADAAPPCTSTCRSWRRCWRSPASRCSRPARPGTAPAAARQPLRRPRPAGRLPLRRRRRVGRRHGAGRRRVGALVDAARRPGARRPRRRRPRARATPPTTRSTRRSAAGRRLAPPIVAAKELQAIGIAACPAFTNRDLVLDEHLAARGFIVDVGPPRRRPPALPRLAVPLRAHAGADRADAAARRAQPRRPRASSATTTTAIDALMAPASSPTRPPPSLASCHANRPDRAGSH